MNSMSTSVDLKSVFDLPTGGDAGMNVLLVTTGINPASGGPTRSVKGLCRALDRAGVNVTLLVLNGHHPFEDRGKVQVLRGARVNVADYDLVHLQGLWHWGLHNVAVACRKYHVPYVVSPRGMLDPWALGVKRWKKRLALLLYQRRDLLGAVAFHVTAALEEKSVRAQGLMQPCILSPNGVTQPDAMPPRSHGSAVKTAIFLSRLHPGKGLLALADAWARVRPRGWVMRVVGPDAYGHKAEVVACLEALGIREQWCFVDMLDDVEKWKNYRSADLLIHPSVSENFGITIAEGLAAGLPVIATKGTPWRELMTRKCGWWIDLPPKESLVAALREATALTREELRAMGARGRKLVEEKYTWEAACKAMVEGYGMICGRHRGA